MCSESGGLPLFQSAAKGEETVCRREKEGGGGGCESEKKKGISREKKESKSKVKGKEWMDDAVNGTGRNHGKGSSASKCHNRQRRQADDGSSSTRGRWWSQAETSVATLPVPRLHSPRQWRLSIAWRGLRRIADVAPLRIFCRHRVCDRDRRQHVWISKEGTPPIPLLTCFSNRPKY